MNSQLNQIQAYLMWLRDRGLPYVLPELSLAEEPKVPDVQDVDELSESDETREECSITLVFQCNNQKKRQAALELVDSIQSSIIEWLAVNPGSITVREQDLVSLKEANGLLIVFGYGLAREIIPQSFAFARGERVKVGVETDALPTIGVEDMLDNPALKRVVWNDIKNVLSQ